jgi:hypothetical protein
MEDQESIEDTKANCGLVLTGTLRDFSALKKYAESLGMRIIYQRSTAPWIHLYVTTKKQLQDWREGP